MRETPNTMQAFNRAGQEHVELVPCSVFVIAICIFMYGVCQSVATVVTNVLSFTNVETGAHAAVSLCAALLFAFLLTCLTLTGLARLSRLWSLVGLTTRLATNTA
jgi:hypothetical protein